MKQVKDIIIDRDATSFLETPQCPILPCHWFNVLNGMSSEKDKGIVVSNHSNSLKQLQAIHLRHQEIAQNEIDLPTDDQVQCLEGGCCRSYLQ